MQLERDIKQRGTGGFPAMRTPVTQCRQAQGGSKEAVTGVEEGPGNSVSGLCDLR